MAKSVDVISDTAKTADKINDTAKTADSIEDIAKLKEKVNPLEKTQYSDKVMGQINAEKVKIGEFHKFPLSVDAFGADGTIKELIGNDGIKRKILEIPGSYNGRNGVFEYIIEPDNMINHRFFNPYK